MAEIFPQYNPAEDPDNEELGVLFDGNESVPQTEELGPAEEVVGFVPEESGEELPISIHRPRPLDSEGGEEAEF